MEPKNGDNWPVGRACHAACCLSFGSENPHLFVIGGGTTDEKVLQDAWIFDVVSRGTIISMYYNIIVSQEEIFAKANIQEIYPSWYMLIMMYLLTLIQLPIIVCTSTFRYVTCHAKRLLSY